MCRHWNAQLPSVHFHRGFLFTSVCLPYQPSLFCAFSLQKDLFIEEKWFCNHYPDIHPIAWCFTAFTGSSGEGTCYWLDRTEGKKCFKIASDCLDFSFLQFWIVIVCKNLFVLSLRLSNCDLFYYFRENHQKKPYRAIRWTCLEVRTAEPSWALLLFLLCSFTLYPSVNYIFEMICSVYIAIYS